MVIDQFAVTAGKDRRPVGQARPVLLAVVGREPSDAAFVRKHGAADRRSADAGWIGGGAGQANRAKSGREGQLSEKSMQNKVLSGFRLPGRGGTRLFLESSEPLKDREGESGMVWVYSVGRSGCQNGNPGLRALNWLSHLSGQAQ